VLAANRLKKEIVRVDAFVKLRSFLADRLPFHLLDGQNQRKRVYDQTTVFLLFLIQTIGGMSCVETVKYFQAVLLLSGGSKMISSATGGYCRAKARIALSTLRDIAAALARYSVSRSGGVTWKGMQLLIVDGTGADMPETKKNRKAYPPRGEKIKGTSFPQLNLTVVIDWASGAVLGWASGNKHWGEQSLWKRIMNGLTLTGKLLLGDTYYGNYGNMAYTQKSGGFFILPLSGRIRVVKVKGKNGKNDYYGKIAKPKIRAKTWSKAQWHSLPDEVNIRIIEFIRERPGYRARRIRLATNLLDINLYSREEIISIQKQRWDIELHFREIKTLMGMDHLASRSPTMVAKEIAMYMCAYNLTRSFMSEAAVASKVPVSKLSFAGAIGQLQASMLVLYGKALKGRRLVGFRWNFLTRLTGTPLPQRPGRSEPRVTKRRDKSFPKMTKTRNSYLQRKVA
jgi:hypothetical protein